MFILQKERNNYGVHPYYHVIENDGKAHGVLLLNSNAMGMCCFGQQKSGTNHIICSFISLYDAANTCDCH